MSTSTSIHRIRLTTDQFEYLLNIHGSALNTSHEIVLLVAKSKLSQIGTAKSKDGGVKVIWLNIFVEEMKEM